MPALDVPPPGPPTVAPKSLETKLAECVKAYIPYPGLEDGKIKSDGYDASKWPILVHHLASNTRFEVDGPGTYNMKGRAIRNFVLVAPDGSFKDVDYITGKNALLLARNKQNGGTGEPRPKYEKADAYSLQEVAYFFRLLDRCVKIRGYVRHEQVFVIDDFITPEGNVISIDERPSFETADVKQIFQCFFPMRRQELLWLSGYKCHILLLGKNDVPLEVISFMEDCAIIFDRWSGGHTPARVEELNAVLNKLLKGVA